MGATVAAGALGLLSGDDLTVLVSASTLALLGRASGSVLARYRAIRVAAPA